MSVALPRGLYVVTAGSLFDAGRLLPAVREALLGGARVVQYRDKDRTGGGATAQQRLAEARGLCDLCREHGAVSIVNDDVGLAAQAGADGVHLGRDDTDVAGARRRLGERAVIGVSCYDSPERARAAADAGADYLAFGSFHPSPTKPAAVRARPALLASARTALGLPLVAIGGITAANGAALLHAGADLLAVCSAVFAQSDVRAAAISLTRLFSEERS